MKVYILQERISSSWNVTHAIVACYSTKALVEEAQDFWTEKSEEDRLNNFSGAVCSYSYIQMEMDIPFTQDQDAQGNQQPDNSGTI